MKKYNIEEIKIKFPDYIKLLKRLEFKIYENGGDYVYIGVDGKRPFGDSSIARGIAEILEWKLPNDDLSYEQQKNCEEYLQKLPSFLNFLIKSL